MHSLLSMDRMDAVDMEKDIWCPDEVLAACHSAGLPAKGSASDLWRVLLFEETASTNDIALREAMHGHPAGLVVAAAAQTKGRGRQGRAWISPRGAGLYVSVLLRPDFAASEASRLTAIAAVAAAQAIESQMPATAPGRGIPVQIKWPNDLQMRGRKVGGVLIEAGIRGGRLSHAVVGIGINVSHLQEDFPEELRGRATSLRLEAQESDPEAAAPRRVDLLAGLMDSLARCLAMPFAEIQARWTERCHTLGREVTLRQPDGATLQGIAVGLGPDGALQFQDQSGSRQSVHAGEVLSEG
ncbi:MAG: biotin--[acetyl-CoA-carboxylase] ligase [Candidatus Methylacidiphilales bacterium]|nr:biotin--[acetyl-CoA-carboxylase] ligase [Candidatus Methylacidiphilales bacterium]